MAATIAAAFYRGNRTFTVEQVLAQAPGSDEVAIRVAYCGVCGTDMHVYHGNMDARVGHNRILGHEMSGVVDAIGDGVSDVGVGQKVVVRPLDHCGDCPACDAGHQHICHKLKFLGLDTNGAMQEIWIVPSHTVHALPGTIRLEDAALIEPLAVACHAVRLSGLKPGEDVLVIGGGPIGILVAMVAGEAGGNVTISEVNTNRIAIAEKLSFTVVNPAETNLEESVNASTKGKGADVVFEVSGTQTGADAMTACAATRARLVMVAIHATKPNVDLFQFFWRELQLIGARVYEAKDYEKAISLIASNTIDANTVITDVRPLEETQAAFDALDRNPTALKTLIKLGEL